MSVAAGLAGHRRGSLRMVGRQVYYEQLGFWLNPIGAVFTVGFSVVFLALMGAAAGDARVPFLPGIREIQYYTAGFLAYGVMSACFNNLAISLVVRRETGLLKRLRLSPLPAWAALAAVVVNALVVSAVQILLLLVIARVGYHVAFPRQVAPLVVTLLVGGVCFSALGIAVSTLVPNQEAAGPVVSIGFFALLFLAGLWYPLRRGSAMARFSAYLPVRPMITAVFRPFDLGTGGSGWAWHDIGVMAAWGAAATVVAVRRWRWAPRRG